MAECSKHFKTPSLRLAREWSPPDLPVLPDLWSDPIGRDPIPDEAACMAVWDRYAMLPHIGRHSRQVALMAAALAIRAEEIHAVKRPNELRAISYAAGLLHDIAKSYTVQYGGSHAQMGAAWVVDATRNRRIAQAVYYHVEWLWPLPDSLLHPVFFVIYADKRAKHDQIVTLEERYDDLVVRYGKTAEARAGIERGREHVKTIERALSAQLEIPLHESSLVDGRLVVRT